MFDPSINYRHYGRKRIVNLTGMRFGRFTVIREAPKAGTRRAWLCQCECGRLKAIRQEYLRSGTGCQCECDKQASPRHRIPEYKVWTGIRERCLCETNHNWALYGGRGIILCQRWAESFDNFLADVGPRPTPNHSLDRIDNNGPYSPENCRWATHKQQMNNTRRCVLLEHLGKTHTITEWAAMTGLNRLTLSSRIKAGWTVERALTTPAKQRIG